jgi:hypothetical protein
LRLLQHFSRFSKRPSQTQYVFAIRPYAFDDDLLSDTTGFKHVVSVK